MPKYSFKRNFFFAIWGGAMTDSGLASCWPHHASCRLHHSFCQLRTAHHVSHTEYDKKHSVNIKFKIFPSVLPFSRVKEKFFRKLLKIA